MPIFELNKQNPVVIQVASEGNTLHAPSPLVLFHNDGTLFPYFLLESLGRDVLGFADTEIAPGEHREGSIVEMGAYYYKQLKASMKPGKIILGGWSFGGLLALEVVNAITLDKSAGFKVIGLILIDSGHALATDAKSTSLETFQNLLEDDLPRHAPKTVLTSMDPSMKKIAEWKLSRWPQGLDKPPAVLIRAAEGLNINCNPPSDFGWRFCEHNVVDSVQIVPRDHFSIFENGNVEILSIRLRDLCKHFDDTLSYDFFIG